MKYANYLILNMVLGDNITCLYKFIFDDNDSNNTKIIKYLLGMEWDYVSS